MTTFNASATIPAHHLKAALLSAPKQDVRYYLTGIYLDWERGLIVSTDGHRLFAGKLPDDATRDAKGVILSREMIERVLKGLTARTITYTEVQVSIVEESHACPVASLTVNGATFTEKPIDGTFPDYPRIIPAKASGELAVYNPDYLVDARDALALYATGSAKSLALNLAYNGNGPGVVSRHDCDRAIVVVMPLRTDGAFSGLAGEAFPDILALEQAGEKVAA